MNHYLIDHTREYLIAGAAYAAQVAEREGVSIRLQAHQDCLGVTCGHGREKIIWVGAMLDWERLATAKENPLPALIDQTLFLAGRAGQDLTARVPGGEKG